jgi:NADH dehydrogenase (ubiquinone) 1 alpha subcomplex subunit 10
MTSLPILLKQGGRFTINNGIGAKTRGFLLTPKNKVLDNIRVATITSKALRKEDPDKPKPWPWREKGYNNWHYYMDKTMKRLDENSKVIAVEGPVACGKSELAAAIAKELDFEYFPMANLDLLYINPYGYDMRQLDPKLPRSMQSYDEKRFIREPNHVNSIVFQLHMYVYKMSVYIDACAHVLNTGQGVVVDRTPFSDFVFAEAMRKCNYIDKKELDVVYYGRKKTIKHLLKPHLVIYLDTPVSKIQENLKKRGQGEEKTLTKEFLETMEDAHKLQYLKDIEEHSELLIYDWSEGGDPEVVVEDIERIDLDCYYQNDPKMKDWRFPLEYDACVARWEHTRHKNRMMNRFLIDLYDVPSLLVKSDEILAFTRVWDSAPGMKYNFGFNSDMGDKNVLFKTKAPPELSGKTTISAM